MRYCLLLLILAAIALSPVACRQGQPRKAPQTKIEPKIAEKPPVEAEPLLLLDDEPAENQNKGPMADNSRCFVCHINYAKEKIAVTHARQDMGCAHCHGESDEHIADESWASGGNGTAPDKMYPKDKINQFCLDCHSKGKFPVKQHKFLADPQSKKVCTDCHGEHRLKERKCNWK